MRLGLLQNDRFSRSADKSANDIDSTAGAVSLIVASVLVDRLDNDFSAGTIWAVTTNETG
jgi:hypothetical protein